MTKYIINSGGVQNNWSRGKEFYREWLADSPKSPNILVVLFAQTENKWAKWYKTIVEEFIIATNNRDASFIQASYINFVQEVEWSDIVYIFGGFAPRLKEKVSRYDLSALFENKVVPTNSAGSCLVSSQYWDPDTRKSDEGLGLAPIKFIPHFQADYHPDDPRGPLDWNRALAELEKFGDKDLPIHALKESDFIVESA